ncbi:MAG: NRDE family protein [SAR324 cluster bacterium]|nr:NRDE family protein [SAR324 cluster bacterium]
MCVLFLVSQQHSGFPFILLSNRDEFFHRPSVKAHYWKEFPDLLAGKDKKAGGTWLGVTRQGKFAIITNYREIVPSKKLFSRGLLVRDFLQASASVAEYVDRVNRNRQQYDGFNLLLGQIGSAGNEIMYVSNRTAEVSTLSAGMYGLSNHLLDSPWPKVLAGKQRLSQLLHQERFEVQDLFAILEDTSGFPDEQLPDTGIGIPMERLLSPLFIKTPLYGTRTSTVILMDQEGNVSFHEKNHSPIQIKKRPQTFHFQIESVQGVTHGI